MIHARPRSPKRGSREQKGFEAHAVPPVWSDAENQRKTISFRFVSLRARAFLYSFFFVSFFFFFIVSAACDRAHCRCNIIYALPVALYIYIYIHTARRYNTPPRVLHPSNPRRRRPGAWKVSLNSAKFSGPSDECFLLSAINNAHNKSRAHIIRMLLRLSRRTSPHVPSTRRPSACAPPPHFGSLSSCARCVFFVRISSPCS